MARRKGKPDAEPQDSPASAGATAVAVAPEPSANGHPETNGEVKNQPVKTYSCPVSNGTIEAAVWGKEILIDAQYVKVYSVNLHKSYRTELGEWKHTNYLRGFELHVACRLLERCEAFILDIRTDEDPPF